MTYRYWKKIDDDGSLIIIFRYHEPTGRVEAYYVPTWVNAFDQWERIVTDPFYIEIDSPEALELLKGVESRYRARQAKRV